VTLLETADSLIPIETQEFIFRGISETPSLFPLAKIRCVAGVSHTL